MNERRLVYMGAFTECILDRVPRAIVAWELWDSCATPASFRCIRARVSLNARTDGIAHGWVEEFVTPLVEIEQYAYPTDLAIGHASPIAKRFEGVARGEVLRG